MSCLCFQLRITYFWLCRSLLYCVCFRDGCLRSHWLVMCEGSCLHNSVLLLHYPFELWSIILYNHKRSVQPWICFVGERTVCRRFPNNLTFCFYCRILLLVLWSWEGGPYSCLFFEMYSVYADLGLLVLMYLQCSLYLVFTFHSVWPIYAFPKVWPVSLYIPHFSSSFSMWFRSFIRLI